MSYTIEITVPDLEYARHRLCEMLRASVGMQNAIRRGHSQQMAFYAGWMDSLHSELYERMPWEVRTNEDGNWLTGNEVNKPPLP